MVVVLCVLLALFVLAAAVLACEVYVLKKSVREIAEQTEVKFRECSNSPVAPLSGDASVRRLASFLTEEIDAVLAARRQYEAGNAELKRAVTNISHDLRTPLTSAAGYLGLLERGGLSEKQAEYVRIVSGRIDAMRVLTEELLDYAVAASGDPPAGADICVNDILEDSLTQFFVAFAERGIEPSIDLCDARVVRRADKESLARIFGNIIHNAVRYSDGDFRVRMSESGRIEFENAAAGMDEVSAGKLFDRFFTVENGRGSTGLGLSIAKALAEKLGFSLDAHWRAGRLLICLQM